MPDSLDRPSKSSCPGVPLVVFVVASSEPILFSCCDVVVKEFVSFGLDQKCLAIFSELHVFNCAGATSHFLQGLEFLFNTVSENLLIVSTHSADLIIGRESNALNSLSTSVSSFGDSLQLVVEYNKRSVDHTHDEVLSCVRECNNVSRSIKFGILELAVVVEIPHTK